MIERTWTYAVLHNSAALVSTALLKRVLYFRFLK